MQARSADYGLEDGNLVARGAGPAPYDEAFAAPGEPRDHYAPLIAELEARALAPLAAQIQREADESGLFFEGESFTVDPVPRLITAAEWATIEEGAMQRARALSAFLADAYGDRRIVEAGVLPERVIDEAEHYEPLAAEFPEPPRPWIAGLDLLRRPDGSFSSLEDNVRTPSGIVFLLRARDLTSAHLGSGYEREPVNEIYGLVGRTLRAASPSGDPSIVVLSDGPDAAAWHEHREVARRLELPALTPEDLYISRGRLRGWVGDRSRAIDVIYRRTDEDRLLRGDGTPTALGALLIEPLRSGAVRCVNSFGAGLADDKALHGYSAALIRFYLEEDPMLPVVRSYDLGEADQRQEAIDRLDELVVKGRGGSGGHEVVVASALPAAELDSLAARIGRDPSAFVAQETVMLSTHPTVIEGELAPRHVDLRPFAFSGGGSIEVVRGGLTRFAPEEGQMMVNSSQGGGGKDTWVLCDDEAGGGGIQP